MRSETWDQHVCSERQMAERAFGCSENDASKGSVIGTRRAEAARYTRPKSAQKQKDILRYSFPPNKRIVLRGTTARIQKN